MIYQLRIFCCVYEKKGFSEAAKSLGLTQSAVSQQIKTLEGELGVLLFDPSDRKRPTSEGDFLFKESFKLLSEIDYIKSSVKNLKRVESGKIKFGMIDTAATGLLPKILKRFKQKYCGVELEALVRPSGELVKSVENYQLDFCVAVCHDLSTSLRAKVFYRDSIVAVTPHKSPLAKRSTISIRELKGEPLILYPIGSYSRSLVENIMRAKGIVPTVAMEMHYPAAIISLVAQGMGIGLLSQLSVSEERLHGQKVLRVSEFVEKREIAVVYQKHRRLSPQADAVIDMITSSDV